MAVCINFSPLLPPTELFRKCGVSTRCYNEFLRPTLLVGLFAPPEVDAETPSSLLYNCCECACGSPCTCASACSQACKAGCWADFKFCVG